MKILVITPTYNELENLARHCEQLLKHNPQVHVLIVDDNSPDGTGQLADSLATKDERISVLHRAEKQGLGPAYLAGFEWAHARDFDYVVEMDGDGSHRAQDLAKLLAVAEGNDLVIGSRWVSGGRVVNWPVHRRLISRVGTAYANLWLGAHIRDITAGFRVYRTSFLNQLDLSTIASHGYSFQVEMAWRSRLANARIIEVPITFVERETGRSKMSSTIVVEALWLITKWGFVRLLGRTPLKN